MDRFCVRQNQKYLPTGPVSQPNVPLLLANGCKWSARCFVLCCCFWLIHVFCDTDTQPTLFSHAFNRQVLLGHENKEIVKCVQDWLSLPDDGNGRPRVPTEVEKFDYRLMQVEVCQDPQVACELLVLLLKDQLDDLQEFDYIDDDGSVQNMYHRINVTIQNCATLPRFDCNVPDSARQFFKVMIQNYSVIFYLFEWMKKLGYYQNVSAQHRPIYLLSEHQRHSHRPL